jgi:queuosine precursor transporter
MEKNELKKTDKELALYIVLAGFFLTNAIIAEVVGVKMFSVEKIFGIPPLNLPFIFSERLSFNMSVGIIIWPIVFIVSDIINEYFGKPGVKRLSVLAAILIGYAYFVIFGGTKLPPADFWLQVNGLDNHNMPFDINYAYSTIFRQGMGIIVGSITAFLVGQLVDIYVFHAIRKATGHKKLWLRATGSTVVSQIVDSFIVLFIAFYWLGNWSFAQVLAVGLFQYLYKISVAIILTPVIYWVHTAIDRYLGRDISKEMIETAENR